jgi:hypothetical protein
MYGLGFILTICNTLGKNILVLVKIWVILEFENMSSNQDEGMRQDEAKLNIPPNDNHN